MSEEAQSNNQQMVMIALVVIAVLLAAIVGVLIWQQSRAAVPAPTQLPTQTQPGATMPGAGMGAATGTEPAADAAPVDPDAATEVPKGTEPEAFVKAYYDACAAGDWKAAYDALPADKKVGQTPEGLQEQVSGYGIKSFAVTDAQVTDDQATITVEQVTGSYGTFVNQWTFTKTDGVWYATGKAVTGMK